MTTWRPIPLRTFATATIVATSTGCPAVDVRVAEEEAGAPEAAPQDQAAPPADATPPQEAATLEGGPSPQTCSTTYDCQAPAYCAKSRCGASQGVCTLPPGLGECPDTEQEVCGCDGVLYWNDCLRQRDGVSFAANGECTTQFKPCSGGSADSGCGVPDAVCARLASTGGPGACDMSNKGLCVVLPDQCPVDTSGTQWAGCASQPPSCTDLCNAARSQQPYVRVPPMSPMCH